MADIIGLIAWILILVFSIVIHEVAHGAVANWQGDPTAKYSGRLTLNPLKHLDMFGSFLLPLGLYLATAGSMVFGYAKPVPINPSNFRDQKYGPAKVAIAGPAVNFILVVLFGLALRFLLGFDFVHPAIQALNNMFIVVVWINLILMIFNLIPIPPLDGSHILFAFLPPSQEDFKIFLQRYGGFILIFLIIFKVGDFSFAASLQVIMGFLFKTIVGFSI
ncbi:MAG TPA: site-2 protease family protein [Candidatus Paceibacterota bacterium]|nr:site-2 protease family protein [Candidatus Pacearchaeota archaeon]HRZ50942.1 site-2 protease family protein [Candidatus Paceibacterota bacterium]HSA36663.1 site-2 protease family protein [Candidatus Paceibacterota bacterium]